MQKFSYVSPMAACGAYYDISAGAVKQEGIIRDTSIALMQEIEVLAYAMDIHFAVDIVATNLAIAASLSPSVTTSMQRDLKQGHKSEMNGLIFEVVRMGKKFGVNVPTYEMIAENFGFKA